MYLTGPLACDTQGARLANSFHEMGAWKGELGAKCALGQARAQSTILVSADVVFALEHSEWYCFGRSQDIVCFPGPVKTACPTATIIVWAQAKSPSVVRMTSVVLSCADTSICINQPPAAACPNRIHYRRLSSSCQESIDQLPR
jgi:hypothetical protein